MQFVSGRPFVVSEVSGPLGFDLATSEALPFARVAFHEIGIDHDRPDANVRTNDLCCFKRANERRGNDDVDRADSLRGMECLLSAEVGEFGVGFSLPTANGVPFRLSVAYK